MRKVIHIITKHRGVNVKPSGSNLFTSRFSDSDGKGTAVVRRDPYNWINYKYAIVFTLCIGLLTILAVDYLFF